MTGKPLLYDVYCGAGGAARGYQLAGFRVIGIDLCPQPRYCGDGFIQMDAFEFFERVAKGGYPQPDAWHASPPCQKHVKGLAATNAVLGRVSRHRDLIPQTRAALVASGRPYVIENVVGAPLLAPIRLCGSSFGLPLRRHRLFESSLFLMAPQCNHAWQREPRYWTSWCPNGQRRLATVVQVYGNAGGRHEWADAMQIDWMTPEELREAIPPVFARFIGTQLLHALTADDATRQYPTAGLLSSQPASHHERSPAVAHLTPAPEGR